MKVAIRMIALTSLVAAAVAGNSLPKGQNVAVLHRSIVPGPVPDCNPLTQNCGNVRTK